MSGVLLIGGKVEDTSPDIDCYTTFCSSMDIGSTQDVQRFCQRCIRLFNANESEALGPCKGRYLGEPMMRSVCALRICSLILT